jgi:hypothetical protein
LQTPNTGHCKLDRLGAHREGCWKQRWGTAAVEPAKLRLSCFQGNGAWPAAADGPAVTDRKLDGADEDVGACSSAVGPPEPWNVLRPIPGRFTATCLGASTRTRLPEAGAAARWTRRTPDEPATADAPDSLGVEPFPDSSLGGLEIVPGGVEVVEPGGVTTPRQPLVFVRSDCDAPDVAVPSD